MGLVIGGSLESSIVTIDQRIQATYAECERDAAKKEQKSESCETFWKRATDDPVAWFTLWLTGLTGILAFSTIALWLVTQGIFRHGRRSTEQQLRAYLFVKECSMDRFVKHLPPFIRLILENTGQTPAWNVRCRFSAEVLPFPSSKKVVGDEMRKFGDIGPSGHQTLALEMDPLTPDMQSDIVGGEMAIYFEGRIDYEDAFGRDQWLTFRLVYGGEMGTSPAGVMLSDYTGNDASR
jgi:hypothetical protein